MSLKHDVKRLFIAWFSLTLAVFLVTFLSSLFLGGDSPSEALKIGAVVGFVVLIFSAFIFLSLLTNILVQSKNLILKNIFSKQILPLRDIQTVDIVSHRRGQSGFSTKHLQIKASGKRKFYYFNLHPFKDKSILDFIKYLESENPKIKIGQGVKNFGSTNP